MKQNDDIHDSNPDDQFAKGDDCVKKEECKTAGPEDVEISLLSWNIDGLDSTNLEARWQAVSSIVEKVNADIVFLQEVVEHEIASIDRLSSLYQIFYSNRGAGYFTAILVSKSVKVVKHEVLRYPNTRMARTLQILEGEIGPYKLFLLNTHLESLGENSKARRLQFQLCMKRANEIAKVHPDAMIIFGGDLNIRDKEVNNVPAGMADAWVAAGSNTDTQWTWDTSKNTNKQQGFTARCRFDRIFWMGPSRSVTFHLEGQDLIPSCNCYPSDHWAVHCTFS